MIGDNMSNIDYRGNANRQIQKYEDAKQLLNEAIEYLNKALENEKKIKGYDAGVKIESDIASKIEKLTQQKKKINTHISSIRSRSRELAEAQDLENAAESQEAGENP